MICHSVSLVSDGYRRGRAVGRCPPTDATTVAAPWPPTRYKDMVGPSGTYGQRFRHQCSYLKALPMSAGHADHRQPTITTCTQPAIEVLQQALTVGGSSTAAIFLAVDGASGGHL